MKDLDAKITELDNEFSAMQPKITAMRAEKKKKADALLSFARARKTDEGSIYSGIDKILQKYGIQRAQYHGGSLNGVHVRVLMDKAANIMDDIAAYLIQSKSEECEKSPEEIREKCNSIKKLLINWDMIFSLAHKDCKDDTEFELNCTQMEVFIESTIEVSRSLGFTTTPKGHGVEDHLVKQMRMVYGLIGCGLKDFDES